MAINGTTASYSNVVELLRPVFDDEIQTIKTDVPVFKYVQGLDKETFDGEKWVIEFQTKRNHSARGFAELGALPDSGVAEFKQPYIRPARIAQPLQIGNELVMLAKRDVSAFSRKAEVLVQDAKDAFKKELNFQALGDGSGTRAIIAANVTGGSATATVTVDSTRFFEEEMLLDIFDDDFDPQRNTPASDGYFVVDSIDSDTQITVSMSGGANVPAGILLGDKIVKAQSRTTAASYNLTGLKSILATGDEIQGLSGATYRRWNAVVYDAGARALSTYEMGKAIIQGRKKVESRLEDRPNVLFTTLEQSLALVAGPTNGQTNDQRFTRSDVAKLGAPNLMTPVVNFGWGDIPVEADLDMVSNEVWALNSDALVYGELHPIQLESWDGVTALPVYDTGRAVAATQQWWVLRANIGCRRRNAFVRIHNLMSPA
jgi:hypothetical protein